MYRVMLFFPINWYHFLLYAEGLPVDDLPDGLKSTCKTFPCDTSLSSKIKVLDTSNFDINNNLVKISRWTCQWKFLFNPDINKQATEVFLSKYFSQSREKNLPLPIIFLLAKNIWALTSIVSLVPISIFSFEKPLLTIYKTLVKPHMEYTDRIYNKPFNDSF